MLELADELMEDIDKNTHNDIAISKMKVLKNNLLKRNEKLNSYIKHEIEKKYTKNKTQPDTENNTEPDTENSIEHYANNKPDTKLAISDDMKAHIIVKQKLIKKDIKAY